MAPYTLYVMALFSFDIVSEYDKAEMNNVFDQTEREIKTRYDFKGTAAAIDWLDANKTGIKLTADNEMQIDAILEIIRKKLATRNQSQKVLDVTEDSIVSNLKTSKRIPFKHGLDQVNAKSIATSIRNHFPKAKAQIQGDTLRVMSSSKDELQRIIHLIQENDFNIPLQFTNFH